ncbi:MAG: PAS domain-containing protein [Dehalococcoidia bacterium]|nr:PAS domain-containing protein [Dehalococcoidia bacterium]
MSVRKMLALMLEAPYGVYAVDMDQRIVFWNSAAERILGHRRDEVIGLRCYEVCASLPQNGTSPICIEGCPSITLAKQGMIPPVSHVQMRQSSGERKPVTVTPLIIQVGRESEPTILVHLFHELIDNTRAREVAENVQSLLSVERGLLKGALPGANSKFCVSSLYPLKTQR